MFHYLFFLNYWYDIPHDGRRTANSQAQQDLINLAASRGEIPTPTETTDQDDATRVALAEGIWTEEKVYAGWALIFGWLLKVCQPQLSRLLPGQVVPCLIWAQVYFILILYSYAAHLRSSTYHALPLTTRSKATIIAHPTTEADLEAELAHHEYEAGASDGQSGKGNNIVGNQEDRAENGQAGPSAAAGSKGKDKKRTDDDDDFSWD